MAVKRRAVDVFCISRRLTTASAKLDFVVWHLPNDTLACVHFSAPGYYHFLLYSFNCRLLQPLTQFWRNFRTIFCLCLFVFVDFLFVFFNGTSSSISNVAARQWPGPEHQNLREVSFIIASRLVLQLMVNTDYRKFATNVSINSSLHAVAYSDHYFFISIIDNKKSSCYREVARCFVSLDCFWDIQRQIMTRPWNLC